MIPYMEFWFHQFLLTGLCCYLLTAITIDSKRFIVRCGEYRFAVEANLSHFRGILPLLTKFLNLKATPRTTTFLAVKQSGNS